jgi:hypothetical protein
MGHTFTATDSVEYEAGVYRAKLIDLETLKGSIVDEKTGQPRMYMKWTFELLEDGYDRQTLRGNSSLAFGPRAKARQWAEALLGRRIESGESVNEDDLIGKECDLMVRPEETDRGTFAKVESVNLLRRKKDKAEKVQPTEVPDEDLETAPF